MIGIYKIKSVHARMVLDSRGNPTVEAEVRLPTAKGVAAVPSGASTGSHEARELRDGGRRFGGLGVNKAITNITGPIARALHGRDASSQADIDLLLIHLDGTPDKSKLGANALLAASLACARAAAEASHVPLYAYLQRLTKRPPVLPIPFANVLNGGRHGDNDLPFQEIMLVPNAKSFWEATQILAETYHALKALLAKKYGRGHGATLVGDEGGFSPPVRAPEDALNLLVKAAHVAGHAGRVRFAMDCAASEFYRSGFYYTPGRMDGRRLAAKYLYLIEKYAIISIEDPFAEDDYESWEALVPSVRRRCQVVGDDLTVSQPDRIHRAILSHRCTALLLKPNQIGTLTEAVAAATLARVHGWNVMVSHRSGETEDAFIADLAVALGCGQIKLGAPARADRTAKYNRLLRLEDEHGRLPYATFSLPAP